RGRWSDGREVAVKVQYPGAGEALMGDLRQISRVARTFGGMLPGIDIKPLVTEWLDSPSSLARLIAEGTQEERNHYGSLYVRFLFQGPARAGLLHADPHPGNFRVLPTADGSLGGLGIVDFGAVARLPEKSLPRTIGSLIRIATYDGYDDVLDGLRAEGFV